MGRCVRSETHSRRAVSSHARENDPDADDVEKIDTTRNKNDLLVERSRQAILKTLDMLSRVYCPETAFNENEKYNDKSAVDKTAHLEEV